MFLTVAFIDFLLYATSWKDPLPTLQELQSGGEINIETSICKTLYWDCVLRHWSYCKSVWFSWDIRDCGEEEEMNGKQSLAGGADGENSSVESQRVWGKAWKPWRFGRRVSKEWLWPMSYKDHMRAVGTGGWGGGLLRRRPAGGATVTGDRGLWSCSVKMERRGCVCEVLALSHFLHNRVLQNIWIKTNIVAWKLNLDTVD